MFRNFVVLFFTILLCNGVISITPIKDLPERVDENGVTWTGPIRKCFPEISALELDECLAKMTEDLKPTIGKGIPEIDLVPLDPLILNTINYDLNAGPLVINIGVKDIKARGGTNFTKLTFRNEYQKGQNLAHFEYEVPILSVDVKYKAGGNAIIFPITGSGPAHLDIYNLKVKAIAISKKGVRSDGVPILQVDKINFTDMSIGGFNLKAQGLFPGNPILNNAVHLFANQYSKQVFSVIRPEAERYADEYIRQIINPALARLPYVYGFLQ